MPSGSFGQSASFLHATVQDLLPFGPATHVQVAPGGHLPVQSAVDVQGGPGGPPDEPPLPDPPPELPPPELPPNAGMQKPSLVHSIPLPAASLGQSVSLAQPGMHQPPWGVLPHLHCADPGGHLPLQAACFVHEVRLGPPRLPPEDPDAPLEPGAPGEPDEPPDVLEPDEPPELPPP